MRDKTICYALKMCVIFFYVCCIIICLEGLTSYIVSDFVLEMRDTLRKSYILWFNFEFRRKNNE